MKTVWVGVGVMEKEVVKEELCINNNVKEESKVIQGEGVPTPPKLHKSVKKLLEAMAFIYKRHCEANKEMEFTVKSFKSLIALYFGFHERNVGPRFNLLQSLGVIKVVERSKTNRMGKVFLNLETLVNFCDDDVELFDIWLKTKRRNQNEL